MTRFPKLHRGALILGVACLAAFAAATAQAGITVGSYPYDDVAPYDSTTWGVNATVTIADTSYGSVLVDGGSDVAIANTRIGYTNASSSGTLTIDGTGSTWTSSSDSIIGYYGTGSLKLLNGGAYTGLSLRAGYMSGSKGYIEVSGNSLLTTNSTTYFGSTGSATVQISSGGTVTIGSNATLYLGYASGSNGTVTVDGAGSALLVPYTGTSNSTLYVGRSGKGLLAISNGGSVNAKRIYITNATSGGGTLTVSGADSVLTNDGFLAVGYGGAGVLNLNGGTVLASTIVGGSNSTSASGVINFNGGTLKANGAANSTWIKKGTGSCTVNIAEGGATFDTNGYDMGIALALVHGGSLTTDGGLTKTGAGILNLSGTNTYTGTTNVNAGTLWANSTAALPGYSTAGRVVVAGGATLAVNLLNSSWNSTAISALADNATWASGSSLGYGYDTTGSDYAASGNIADIGSTIVSVVKLGANTLTLSGANTYSGTTSVSAGTLAYGVENATGLSSIVVSGGTLSLGDYSGTSTAVALTSGAITGSGTLTSTGAIAVQSGTISANLGGSGNLTKSGTGTVVLSGANSYTGATAVNAGALLAATSAALCGTIAVNNSGSTLAVQVGGSGWTSNQVDTLLGSVSWGADTVLGIDTTNGDFTYNTTIAQAIGLTKLGENTLTLGGANTHSGMNTVLAGTLALGANNALGSGGVTVNGGTLNTGTYTDTVASVTLISGAIAGSGTLTSTSDFSATTGTISACLAGSVGFNKIGSATVVLTGANTYTGTTTSADGSLQLGDGTTNGSVAGDIVVNSGNVTFKNATAQTYAGGISGAGQLVKYGAGELTLSGANAYSGITAIMAGTLTYGANDALGSGDIMVQGGVLNLGSHTDTVAIVLINGGTITGGTLTSNSGVGSFSVGYGYGHASVVSSVLAGTGGLYLGDDASDVTLLADNIYTGGTWVMAGVLRLGDGTTNGSIVGNIYGESSRVVFNNKTAQIYAGVISDSGNPLHLIKSGAGKLTLTGANSYNGTTTVSAGTLEFGANSQNVVFTKGGASVGNAILEFDYGAGSPLSSINTAITNGKINHISTDTTLVWAVIDDLSTKVTVAYTVNGDSNLDFLCDGADLNTVLSNYNSAGNWFKGNFNGDTLVDGADLNIVLSNYNKSASAATAAVPEPSTLALVFAGLAALAAYGWRKRK